MRSRCLRRPCNCAPPASTVSATTARPGRPPCAARRPQRQRHDHRAAPGDHRAARQPPRHAWRPPGPAWCRALQLVASGTGASFEVADAQISKGPAHHTQLLAMLAAVVQRLISSVPRSSSSHPIGRSVDGTPITGVSGARARRRHSPAACGKLRQPCVRVVATIELPRTSLHISASARTCRWSRQQQGENGYEHQPTCNCQ